ncbi:hypothetical protein HNR23_000786 [Nocardiopsis mwathae]|uniref:FtsK domain-containing protein n=1 Tax=Nocardiopsis mwathae TaxID=1472723 RepID=A0A7W9YG88_9ACTN|nr:FtsK/SpoIIIE domain-containing protein [Nocardiopsis mwathae]MBB6170726.1 hypothetical protein [Nocardiopsis mwathae]
MTEEQRKPVGLTLWESPEVQTRSQHTAASWIAANVVRPAWLWRREAAVLLGPVLVGAVPWAVSAAVGAPLPLSVLGSGIAVSCAVAAVLLVVTWRWSAGWLWRGRIRRKWDSACRYSGVETTAARVPRVTRVERHPAAVRLNTRLPKGLSTDEVAAAAEKLAVVLDVREVKVTRDPERARFPIVDLQVRNPFRDSDGQPVVIGSPLASAASWDVWDNGVPLGLDTLGAPLTIRLVGRNILVAGEPEAGKSVAAGLPLAAAALDPNVRIFGIDAKQVEFALWAPVMERVVYNDVDDAIDLLDSLIAEMDERYAKLRAEGMRSAVKSLGWPVNLLAIDEMRFFTAHPDKKKRDRFNAALIDLIARGRAAAFPVLTATQKPSTDVVPSSIRDLIAYRWAMRCSTRDASDTILGAGWASEGYSASRIDMADRGVGLLLAEGGIPAEVKSAYLDDDAIKGIVARGAGLRGWSA